MLDLDGLVAVALHFGAHCRSSPATRRSPPTFTTRHHKGALRFPTLATGVPALAIVHFVRRRGAALSGEPGRVRALGNDAATPPSGAPDCNTLRHHKRPARSAPVQHPVHPKRSPEPQSRPVTTSHKPARKRARRAARRLDLSPLRARPNERAASRPAPRRRSLLLVEQVGSRANFLQTGGTRRSPTRPRPARRRALQARSGHSSFATPQLYIDLAGETFREEPDRLEERCSSRSGRQAGKSRASVGESEKLERPRSAGLFPAKRRKRSGAGVEPTEPWATRPHRF
jgi:hypothetical protein